MRANRLLLSVAVIAAAGLSGCGSITDGGSQTVHVVVKGSQRAFCQFTTSKFRNDGQFPNTVTLERSHENLQADCTGEQNRHVAFEVPTHVTKAGTFGNVVYGILPGTAYDVATGGLYTYPDPIIVDFREIGEGPAPAWPANTADAKVDPTRIGVADIAPPSPVRMVPIMDEDLNPAVPARPGTVTTVKTVTQSKLAQPQTEIVDAARLAVDNPQPVVKTTTTTTTVAAAIEPKAGGMKPIASPEDKMGLDPAKVKAQAAAKAKAKEEAVKKAKEDAEAKKRAAEDAKKAAEEAAKAAALPETPATPPAEPAPAAEPAPTTTTTTTTTTPATEAAPAQSTTTTTTITPAEGDASKGDMDKYLEGGH